MRSTSITLLGLVTLLLATACGDNVKLPVVELQGLTMGTSFAITLISPPDAVALETLQLRIEQELADVEALASTYDPDSELSLFNNSLSSQWQTVSVELCAILSEALRVSQQTNGAFDLTIGPLVDLWGFGPANNMQRLPTEAEIAAALQSVGYAGLTLACDRPAKSRSIRHCRSRMLPSLRRATTETFMNSVASATRTRSIPERVRQYAMNSPPSPSSAIPQRRPTPWQQRCWFWGPMRVWHSPTTTK